MKNLNLLVIDMGVPSAEIKAKYGPYSKWFWRAFQATDTGIDSDSISVNDVDIDDLLEADGIVLSGALENVGDVLQWREHFNKILSRIVDEEIPVLGVCFGHQYLASFLGGHAEAVKGCEEFGNFEIDLTTAGEKDPLFSGINNPGWFIESHFQQVTRLPEEAVLLASSDKTINQAFRFRGHIWGTQFHPEMTPGILMTIIDELEVGDEEKERWKYEAQNPHDGLRLLLNFAKFCRDRIN